MTDTNTHIPFSPKHLAPHMVVSVYNGPAHGCMCGCNGKYRYNPEFREESSKARGYDVGDDEVSLTAVKRAITKVQKAHEAGETVYTYPGYGGQYCVLETEGRESYNPRSNRVTRRTGRQTVLYFVDSVRR